MPQDILQNVWNRIIKAGEALNYEVRLMEELTSFKMRLSFDLDATVAGKPERLKAVRVWHRAPLTDCIFKGGTRYRPGLTLNSMESHAAEMSIKCWLHNLPYGGAKGGIDLDPNKCTPEELEKITYRFVDELNERSAIGPFRDVPAPDMGTDSLIMFWMAQRYSYLHRGEPYIKAVVTGKPVNPYIGGLHGRTEATGFGLITAYQEMSRHMPIKSPTESTMAIQGFGNVGMHVARFASNLGIKVIAVCDEFGGVFDGKGLNIQALIQHARSQKPATVSGFPGAHTIRNEDLFSLRCDILVPAAAEEVITKENADLIMANIVLEGANGPTTPEADAILSDKGIVVIPDIYANSGGVVTSYFEWARNTDNFSDTRVPTENDYDVVIKALERMMCHAGQEIVERSKRYNVSLRLAAYILALEKAELMRARRIPGYAMEMFRPKS